MSYDASAVTTYLTDHYPELIADASLSDLGPVVADVTAIFIAYPTLDPGWANPLADYYFLKRVAAAYASNFDLSDQTGSLALSQQYKDVKTLLDAATKAVAWLVFPQTPDDQAKASSYGKVVRVTSNYLTGDLW